MTPVPGGGPEPRPAQAPAESPQEGQGTFQKSGGPPPRANHSNHSLAADRRLTRHNPNDHSPAGPGPTNDDPQPVAAPPTIQLR
jgi:hypothetical protein